MKIIRPALVKDDGLFSRATVARYVDKNGVEQIAPANTPRFTFDPTDLTKPPILMLENAATNLFLNSEDMSVQTKGANITYVGVTDGPVGQIGYKFSSISGSNSYVSQGIATTTGLTYTFSYWLRLPSGVVGGAFYVKDSTNGAATFPISVVNTKAWQKVSVTVTAVSSATVFHVGAVDSPAGYTFDIAKPMVEVGTSATSYIATGASAVARGADNCTLGMVSLLAENEYPLMDLAKAYAIGDRVINAADHVIYESAVGTRATVTTTATGSAVVWTGHGRAVGDVILFEAGLTPTGVVLNTAYYVRTITDVNNFTLTATPGGTALTIGTSSGSLTVVGTKNYGVNPTGDTAEGIWIRINSTNKWAMYDSSVESQTSSTDFIASAMRMPTDTLVDSVVIQNANAVTVRVAVITLTDGVVYDKTISMVSNDGINNPYLYSFEPTVRNSDVLFTGIPPYAGSYISVSAVGYTGESVACGLCLMGLSKNFGPTQAGMTLGATDYSVKARDDYGNSNVKERPYSRTMTLTCFVDKSKTGTLLTLLNKSRAIPIVYIGDESLSYSVQYGFYKDYSLGADYPETSVLHLEIESMT